MKTMMEENLTQVDLLHRISRIVSSERTMDEMLGEVIGLTSQVTGCDACLVYLLDEENGELVLRASQLPHARELDSLSIKLGEGVTGWAAQHNSVVALPRKAAADARFKSFRALVEDTYEAFLAVPLLSKGQVIGMVNIHHREEHEHTPSEVALLTFVGEQMGNALAKADLEEANVRLAGEKLEIERELATRKIVERAKGILQRAEGLTEEEAYLKLRNESRRMRRPMKELAEAIILTEDMKRKVSPE
jgi:two-component system, response regulator PdtaR